VRSNVPRYDLRTPANLDDVLALLAAEPGRWRPFAGGTDIMVLLEAGRLDHTHYVSLWGVRDLRFIDVTDREVAIGATTTYTDVLESRILRDEFPLLCSAAAETGGHANQNRGTIGGNIANGSPAADTPPTLLTYDAELELISKRGSRRVAYAAFHTGYKRMDLAPDEIIRAIHLPRQHSLTHQLFRKAGARRAQAIAKVCFAAGVAFDAGVVRDARVAFGSVAPTVVRARTVESALRGQRLDRPVIAAAAAAIASDLAPIDDIRSTAEYRQEVARNMLEHFLVEVSRSTDA
jgi:CO/xanthine dehydrogenase FAD-binding subunit